MIKITFNVNPKTIEILRTKGARIVSVLTSTIGASMLKLAGYVQSRKLSGQVLAVRTGILRGSVHALPVEIQGTKIVGAVEGAGGPAFYGNIFETGGRSAFEILPVKARALSFITGGNRVFAMRVLHPPLKQRAFMEPSLQENEAKIRTELNAAVNNVITE